MAALRAAKLRALVADGFDVADLETSGLPAGAVGVRGDTMWFLADGEVAGSVGSALALARRDGVNQVHVLVDGDAALVARLAAHFTDGPTCWHVADRALTPAVPRPPSPPPPVEDGLDDLTAVLRAADCDVVVEHGVVTGEVMGLEVARVVSDHDGPRIEVGVGAQDREAFQMLYGDRPTADSLAQVVATVGQHRSPGAEPHPLNRLRAERWLRALVIRHPAAVGADRLDLLPPPEPRRGLSDEVPACAVGVDTEGSSIVVACSVGIDVDLVPQAADARAMVGGDAELVIAVPARDAHPLTGELLARLEAPARLVPLPGDWRTLGASLAS